MATNKERILQFIGDFPGRDDDAISLALRIFPRQTVNIACRDLEARGLIIRRTGANGKISNFPRAQLAHASPSAGRAARPDVEGEQVLAPARAPLSVEALKRAGFVLSARWRLGPSGGLQADAALPSATGVYAFAMEGRVLYVGVAMMGLARRLHFYSRPGRTQKTSQRLNRQLIEYAEAGQIVEIYTAQPADLAWNGLPVSGAAGLEVGLIKSFHLPWNIRGS